MKKKDSTDVLKQFKILNDAKEDIIYKIQTRKSYEVAGCKEIDFTDNLHIEYVDDVFFEDLSTDEQLKLGMSVFYVKINKTTNSPVHEHDKQSQLVFVKEGSVYDRVSKNRFERGESFFISKKNKHSLKYIKNSEVLIIYLPGLTILE